MGKMKVQGKCFHREFMFERPIQNHKRKLKPNNCPLAPFFNMVTNLEGNFSQCITQAKLGVTVSSVTKKSRISAKPLTMFTDPDSNFPIPQVSRWQCVTVTKGHRAKFLATLCRITCQSEWKPSRFLSTGTMLHARSNSPLHSDQEVPRCSTSASQS